MQKMEASSCITGLPRRQHDPANHYRHESQDNNDRRQRQRRPRPRSWSSSSSAVQLSTTAMVTFLLYAGITPTTSSSVLRGRNNDDLESLPDHNHNHNEPHHSSSRHHPAPAPAPQPQPQPQNQPQQPRQLRSLPTALLEKRAEDLLKQNEIDQHPFIPIYAKTTCNNDRPAQTWERAYETLSQCCEAHFSWQKDYNEVCLKNWIYLPRPPKDDETKKKVYPYSPKHADGTCYNTEPPPIPQTWEEMLDVQESGGGSKSLKKCCGKYFKHKMKSCMDLGQAALVAIAEAEAFNELSEDEKPIPYLPNWGTFSCTQDRVPELWEGGGYGSLEECCGDHFDWTLDTCLGADDSDNGGVGDDGLWYNGQDATNNDEDGIPTSHPETWWHALWPKGHCITNHEQPPPQYMTNDPEGQMQKTFKECCTINFPDSDETITTCLELSSAMAPPTRPPSIQQSTLVTTQKNGSSSGGGGGSGVDYDTYYYPKYTDNKCYLDGNDAPKYMKRDPITYFTMTPAECCREHFPEDRKSCVKKSPSAPPPSDGNNGGSGGGGQLDSEEKIIPSRYKYHYYPTYSKIACIKNVNMDAPSYMFDSVDDFFFLNYDECCSVSFDLEYMDCLSHSKLVGLDLPLDDPYGFGDDGSDGSVEEYEPAILLRFGGKLYFRNVFIPSSTPGNMRIVRDAVLNSVKVSLDGFRVIEMVGTSFDGIDLIGLDDFLIGRRHRRGRRLLRGKEEDETMEKKTTTSQRKLNSMQLFRFNMAISIPCDASCSNDITYTGRSNSLDIADLFADAIADNIIFTTLSSDMEGMGLVGPFFAASLDEGFLQYEGVEWDGTYTRSPTYSPKPTKRPSGRPTTAGPTTRRPTRRPTEVPTDMPVEPYPFYPDFDMDSCVADGRHSEFQPFLYDTLDECCNNPWLKKNVCMLVGGADTARPTTSNPTPTPPTPNPTPSPSPDPTRKPSAKPSKKPTPKPTPLNYDDSDWPTFSPTTDEPTTSKPTKTPKPTKNPTASPTKYACGANGWHLDRVNGDGCSNDDNFHKSWISQPAMKDRMFRDTAQACCDAFGPFPGQTCEIYDVCGTGGGEPPAPLPVDVATPVPTPTGQAPEPPPVEPPSSCSIYGWHIHRLNNDGCSDDGDIMPGWLNPGTKEAMFVPTAEACCDQFFSGKDCKIYDSGCGGQPAPVPAPGQPDDSPTLSCGGNGWHAHRLNNDGCSDDDDVVEQWLANPVLKSAMFFSTAQACCDKIYAGKDCRIYDSTCESATTPATTTPTTPPTTPPTPVPTPASPSFSSEDFEVENLSQTKFTTGPGLPWKIDDEISSNGSKSVTNSVTARGQSSKLKLSADFPGDGILVYKLRHDVFMPWAQLQVFRDGEVISGYSGHTGEVEWGREMIPVTEGSHEIVWDVHTNDLPIPPGNRGNGTVWVDDVTYYGTQKVMDWEDDEFDDELVSFSGMGKWRIDDSMPGRKTGVAAHSPRGLLAGEHSTMEIKWTSPIDAMVSFDCHLGLGKFSFFVDDSMEFTSELPGAGTQKIKAAVSPGDHILSFKYEPPKFANMPMSMVWIDNVAFDL